MTKGNPGAREGEPGQTRFRFADCEIVLATRQLRRAGAAVALQPRVFDLLAFLLEERDRAVDKDEIQDAVWTGMVVSETALTRAIMKARRAVGDDADRQEVIRTVHGHGYQFIAPLDTGASQTTHAPEVSQRAPRGVRWILAAAALALTIGIVFLLRGPLPVDGVRLAVLPVTNATGDTELDWVKLGLMGFANELFEDATELETVPASEVVRFAENVAWEGNAAEAESRLDTLRRAYGATHILLSELQQNAGGLRLNYTLVGAGGLINESTMVSDKGTELVRGMVLGVSGLLSDQRHLPAPLPEVTDDPFINEAYMRATSFALEGRCGEALPLFEIVRARLETVSRADIEWARCARIAGRRDEAEIAYQTVLAALPEGDASPMRARALDGLGSVYIRTGRLDDADEVLNRGLEEAVAAEDLSAQGSVLNNLSILARNRRDYANARDYLARATLAYREIGVELLPGQLYSALANIAMGEGKLSEAGEHLDNALVTFRELGDRRNEAMMLNNYGYLRRLQGRFADAEPLHLESLAIRREIGDRVGQGRILGMLSTLYEREMRYAEARDAAAEAVMIARDANDTLFQATGLAQLAAAGRHRTRG